MTTSIVKRHAATIWGADGEKCPTKYTIFIRSQALIGFIADLLLVDSTEGSLKITQRLGRFDLIEPFTFHKHTSHLQAIPAKMGKLMR